MVNSVNGNVLELERLYKLNVIDYLNFLSYQKDKHEYKNEQTKD